ncbi:hypothetical protein [Glutamicibacter uratoxydans]|nr:hypothetical protein [Glutamicibacter uratoxydans]
MGKEVMVHRNSTGSAKLLIGAALASLMIITTSCSPPNSSSSTTESSNTTGAEKVELTSLLSLASEINEQDQKSSSVDVIASAVARPFTEVKESSPTAATIRDVSQAEHVPGTYRLIVTCVGEGSIQASFTVGARKVTESIPNCEGKGTVKALENIVLDKKADNSEVLLSPAETSNLAVAYRIEKDPAGN